MSFSPKGVKPAAEAGASGYPNLFCWRGARLAPLLSGPPDIAQIAN
jgi:hypothetical protein